MDRERGGIIREGERNRKTIEGRNGKRERPAGWEQHFTDLNTDSSERIVLYSVDILKRTS